MINYIFIGLALLLLAYIIAVRIRVNTGSRKGSVIPLFEPPMHLSPAAMRYIVKMKCDSKTLTAAIVSMASKDYINVNTTAGRFTLERSKAPIDVLSDDEKTVASVLFSDRGSVEFNNQASVPLVDTAQKWLDEDLSQSYKKYLNRNFLYLLPGIILALLLIVFAGLSSNSPPEVYFILLWLSFWTSFCFIFLYNFILNLKVVIKAPTRDQIILTSAFLLFFLFFFAAEILIMYMYIVSLKPSTFMNMTVGVAILVLILFIHIIKSRSKEGRQLMDQIEGFKLFLATSERYRLKESIVTPDFFEKYLAYAIALDIENEWGEHFSNILKTSLGIPIHRYRGFIGDDVSTEEFASLISDRINKGLLFPCQASKRDKGKLS